jgi:hypothetical protein
MPLKEVFKSLKEMKEPCKLVAIEGIKKPDTSCLILVLSNAVRVFVDFCIKDTECEFYVSLLEASPVEVCIKAQEFDYELLSAPISANAEVLPPFHKNYFTNF